VRGLAAFPAYLADSAARAARGGIAWGIDDCAMEAATWWMAATGIDIAAGWRGRYGSGDDVRAMMRGEPGGFVGAMRRHLAAAGLTATDAPEPGDIAIVKAPRLVGERVRWLATGGVMVPTGRWRLRQEGGFVTGPFPVIAAWSLAAFTGGR